MICTFCHQPKEKVKVLLASPDKDAFICDGCIAHCAKMIKEELHVRQRTTS